eukprot:m.257149 g.257149  ORF g.257149 m.257149 type:complete len:53 (-) comp35010_c0_seq1:83-241(-)
MNSSWVECSNFRPCHPYAYVRVCSGLSAGVTNHHKKKINYVELTQVDTISHI